VQKRERVEIDRDVVRWQAAKMVAGEEVVGFQRTDGGLGDQQSDGLVVGGGSRSFLAWDDD